MKIKFVLPLFILGLANIVYGQSDYKNLKVLDPKIEESELKLLMKGYAKGLGVKCTFCHVRDAYHKAVSYTHLRAHETREDIV